MFPFLPTHRFVELGRGPQKLQCLQRDYRLKKSAVKMLKEIYNGAWFQVTPPHGELEGRSERER